MPASIAHMVIAHNALTLLKDKGFKELADFAALLDDPAKGSLCQAYMNLGSIGPDLYYYASMAQSAKEMLLEGFVDAAGVTPWSYHLHSQKPNQFPLHLGEILFQDAVWEDGRIMLDIDDHRKLAYIAGHLSHIAADQIIHPLVNRIAKPYYRSGANRKKHRQCEVYQDYFLYEEVYRGKRQEAKGKKGKATYSFFDQDFRKWVDCVPGLTTRNTQDWFRYFLQRGFAETYGVFPSEADIENSVDNLLLVLRVCKIHGPYKEAQEEYQEHGADGDMYREYVAEPNYLTYYDEAVRLSAVYMAALYEVYTTLAAGEDFDDPQQKRFREIVSDADLSCPLEKDILQKARERLTSGPGGASYEPLFAQS
jgi:hypothetical protein